MKKKITIGISGPIDLKLLNWSLNDSLLPSTNGFPLTSHLINAFVARGYQVIGYTNSNEITEPLVFSEGNITICVGRTKPQPGRRIFNYERQELQALIKEFPADVIYAFWSYEFAWAALDSGIPTIVSVHDIARRILLTQPDIFRLVRWYMNYRVMKKAKYLAANSSYTFEQLSSSEKKRAEILSNFYASTIERQIPFGLQKDNFIISVSMGFTKRKGVPTALKAFALLRKKYPTLKYHLVGVGMEPGGEAQQFAEANGIATGVEFLGQLPLEKVLEHVAKAKVMVHASVEESFGMAVLESMVVGTTVVGGQKSGFIPQLLDNGSAGILCDINSPEAIAAATATLLDDEKLNSDIANKAAAFAKANYSEQVVVSKYLNCMDKLFNLGKPAYNTQKEIAKEVA
jgi:L-malate glycosyltransferase